MQIKIDSLLKKIVFYINTMNYDLNILNPLKCCKNKCIIACQFQKWLYYCTYKDFSSTCDVLFIISYDKKKYNNLLDKNIIGRQFFIGNTVLISINVCNTIIIQISKSEIPTTDLMTNHIIL